MSKTYISAMTSTLTVVWLWCTTCKFAY